MSPFNFPEYCRQQHLSYVQLAARLGISRSYACQLRLGRKPLTMRVLRLLMEQFALSGDLLLANIQIKTARATSAARQRRQGRNRVKDIASV